MKRRDVLALGLASAAAPLVGRAARAQGAYPERPIRVIVPFSPGGVVDVIARPWAEKVKPGLGTVIIENQGGGGGIVGASEVAHAPPDGYTLLFGNTSTQIIAPTLMARPPYDAQKDFAAVGVVALSYTAIMVHPSVPATTFREFIDYAKANAARLSYGSAGTGTVTHVTGEMFKQLIGAPQIVHIPYRGAGPGITDLVSGVIPMMTTNITGQYLDLHRAGRIRVLATCGPKRLKAAPDIPAANETLPELVAQLASGIFVPGRTPRPIIDKISQATRAAMTDAGYLALMEQSGLEAITDSTPENAQAFMAEEQRRLVPVMQAAGMNSAG
jgi:tripartite-type tricarboxylate transporter receptor subunit TctC